MKQFAVVTLCVGEQFAELGKLTHPRMREYARHIGADFIVLGERKFNTDIICYEKLQIGNLLECYGRVIYFDSDILLRPSLPNLFTLVDEESFGCFAEGSYLSRDADLRKANEDGWGNYVENASRYFNAGMFVASKCHKDIFSAPNPFINNFQDQTWLNCQVWKSGTHVEYLPYKFDHMPSLVWHERAFSHVIHYAGGATGWIKRDIEEGL